MKTASHALVPKGMPAYLWRRLGPEEKLYLKGLDVESHGEFRAGVYQEFARGFGVRDYRVLIRYHHGERDPTENRLRTWAPGVGGLRIWKESLAPRPCTPSGARRRPRDTIDSHTWLHTELSDYWSQREALTAVLRYLAAIGIDHWRADSAAARIVAGAVENDHV